jgi:hypothetical protein
MATPTMSSTYIADAPGADHSFEVAAEASAGAVTAGRKIVTVPLCEFLLEAPREFRRVVARTPDTS